MSLDTASTSLIARLRGSSGTVQGILWMIGSTLSFVAVTGIIRYLGSELPAAQSAFIRYAFGIFLVLPALIRIFRDRMPKDLFAKFAFRGFVHTFGVTLWFFAMARIPIAEVTAIGYVTPIFVTIGAAVFLGEKLRARRLFGVLMGLTGALIILRPGFQEISIGQFAQLAAGPLFATSYLMTKSFTGKTDSQTIVAMLTVFCTLFLFPLALIDWQPPSQHELIWLFITAICATIGHYCMTRALQAAPVSVTQPVTFLQLVWASTLGIVVFNEAVDPFVILGGMVIVGAATFISHREAKAARAPITPSSVETKSH
ncbi:DMT family transporter [Pseudahrensia aquimaris]|uniref:DMT family transporter n=1 Tax=Pseudahrensia aquimaris TaxID=744461 RepID=A0ABW3FFF4_9HYPH